MKSQLKKCKYNNSSFSIIIIFNLLLSFTLTNRNPYLVYKKQNSCKSNQQAQSQIILFILTHEYI